MNGGLKQRLYVILEGGKTSDWPSRLFDGFMVILILANVAAFALQTVPRLDAAYGRAFVLFNTASVIIFTIEYGLRLWVCTEHPPLRAYGPLSGRLRFALTPYMLLDLVVILPFYLSFFLAMDLRVLRVFRLLRFLKLVRFSPALTTLVAVIYAERRALLGALVIMFALLITSASLIYVVEGKVQPEVFGTVPDGLWWAVATLTTVGYGDVVPVTGLGKLIGAVVMILGFAMFALPVGIIATGFSQQIHRREFVVNWGLVARVPLFADLDAGSLADVMDLIRARVVDPETVLVREGDPADGMYFISLGEVMLTMGDRKVRLGEGDWFGEISLLRDVRRIATIRALSKCHLLFIDASDFRALMDRNPELSARINESAEDRLRNQLGFAGDLTKEELERSETAS